jgi:hypothetical protein
MAAGHDTFRPAPAPARQEDEFLFMLISFR